ncbi:MAG: ABC transporter permease [Bryobacterales bacterium]
MANHSFDAVQPRSETAPVLVETAVARPSTAEPSLLLGVATLWWREVRSFYRQRSRIVAALATPLLFWLVLGSGFGSSLQAPGAANAGYLEFFFPGTVTLVILFTAIFANISIIEDRREGFLLSVLVAPVPRLSLVLGKVLGATTVGLAQGLLLLPLAPMLGLSIPLERVASVVAMIFLLAFGLTCLGFCFAWQLNSVSGFHSIMNTVLMPMWLLSGALFPLDGASAWVRYMMLVNPLTYGVAGLRHLLYEGGVSDGPALMTNWIVMGVFAVVSLGIAAMLVSARGKRNLS